jgi:hypothetical protein
LQEAYLSAARAVKPGESATLRYRLEAHPGRADEAKTASRYR